MDYGKVSLEKHYQWQGKIEVVSRVAINSRADLSLAYTPGVANSCLAIQKDILQGFQLTRRSNLVAVVTDGSAVLGLGNIGPEAAMPVMEGKCVLFKQFAGVDAFPLCIRSQKVEEIVNTVALLAGSFGGINLEDIAAPRCFEIERRLKEICDIPIFHDDQHGTAVVVLAALINALTVTGKKMEDISITINGAGAAGLAIAKILLRSGAMDIVLVDKAGIVDKELPESNWAQKELASLTNKTRKQGGLIEAVKGADVFIGVSAANVLSQNMIKSMAKDPIIFALANPIPEIMPQKALAAGAAVVGSGRSDLANQINNVLAFPGIFRGALDARAADINDEMKIAAAKAIAGIIKQEELAPDYIIPSPLDKRVAPAVAKAVERAAKII